MSPGMLVVGGFNIDSDTLDALGIAAGQVVQPPGLHPNLLAIVISNLRVAVRGTLDLEHMTRIRSNDRYSGPVRFVGEWAGEWHLVEGAIVPSRG